MQSGSAERPASCSSTSVLGITAYTELFELHKGRHSTPETVVVIKGYSKAKLKPRQLRNVTRELHLLRLFTKTRCRGVVQLISSFEEAELVYLVFEACMHGDLYQLLVRLKGQLTEEFIAAQIVAPLLSTLAHLHALHIVHRDIKPENIFISAEGQILIGDFGLAAHTVHDKLTERVGTLDYMAPEVLAMPTPDELSNGRGKQVRPYNEKVDVWAVGILVYEMLVGAPPFEVEDPKETAHLIMHTPVGGMPASLSPECTDFIRQALEKRASARPTAEELLQHPWLLGYLGGAPLEPPCPALAAKALKRIIHASWNVTSLPSLLEPLSCSPVDCAVDVTGASSAQVSPPRKASGPSGPSELGGSGGAAPMPLSPTSPSGGSRSRALTSSGEEHKQHGPEDEGASSQGQATYRKSVPGSCSSRPFAEQQAPPSAKNPAATQLPKAQGQLPPPPHLAVRQWSSGRSPSSSMASPPPPLSPMGRVCSDAAELQCSPSGADRGILRRMSSGSSETVSTGGIMTVEGPNSLEDIVSRSISTPVCKPPGKLLQESLELKRSQSHSPVFFMVGGSEMAAPVAAAAGAEVCSLQGAGPQAAGSQAAGPHGGKSGAQAARGQAASGSSTFASPLAVQPGELLFFQQHAQQEHVQQLHCQNHLQQQQVPCQSAPEAATSPPQAWQHAQGTAAKRAAPKSRFAS